MLQPIEDNLWVADGPNVSFYGIAYPTRMGLVRLPDGALWVWSPIALDPELAREIAALGEVRHIVEPNRLHHLPLAEWQARWPRARLYSPPGLAKKRADLRFDAELGDEPVRELEGQLEHVVVRGSFAMEEVLFFHRPSATAFVGDLVQKHDPKDHGRWEGALMKLDGLMGPDGSTPREWRATFLHREVARQAIRTALAWAPERVIIAHGAWAKSNGAAMLRDAFSWLLPAE